MIVDKLIDLPKHLAEKDSLIGLDLGTKTIGLAVSDNRRMLASSITVIVRKKFTIDAQTLINYALEYEVGGIIIGLPVNMNGTEGPRSQSTRQFAENLASKTALPISFWDERLSTQAVEKNLIAQNVSRRRRKKVVDKLAAQFILQGALDFLQNNQS